MSGKQGEISGHHLRVFVRVDSENFASAHFDDVHSIIAVRASVDTGVRRRPPHDDGRVVRKSLHPDVMDIQG